MDLRDSGKSKFVDKLIFSARMPAELAEEILTEKTTDGNSEQKDSTDSEEE
jgi:hypothetical protein